ncbi:manganese efflux pump MntP family protein [Texcoconibacillus texcoconensis]|uniref:Putative Mn2+ efflux pump MntP n=1 Tax=Texcoconibacillus texcoconensis TaxID=1095777 RepID=A0A840QLZ7_9BACI|nr:manganese efflux pump [Texcoconibacillus texcoconensis]MBB5172402.1 putative Mn2+ efflux pump MntP [Texcoconibacillus texcoconensis]
MLWQLILLAIASNIDDLAAGVALGLKGRIPWRVIWVIAVLSGLTMSLGIIIGTQATGFLPGIIPIYFGTAVFAGIGCWFIWQGLKKGDHEEGEQEVSFGWKASIILGLALGVDSFAAGFSGGLTGYPIILTGFLAFSTSLLFIWVGSRFGNLISIRLIKDKVDYISGGLFILLSILIFFLELS